MQRLEKIKERKGEKPMTDKVKKQVEWVVDKLLSWTIENTIILVVYEKKKKEAKIYLNSEKVATISEEVSSFGWPLTKEEIEKLYEELAHD